MDNDYEDFGGLMDLKDKWKHIKGFVWAGVIGIVILIFVSGTFYTVQPDQNAVIQRFGRYVRKTGPGLHFKLPLGIEKTTKIKVKYIFKQEFGFRAQSPGIRTQYSAGNFEDESIMLTGDLNIADMEWIVQFNVQDPYKTLFKVRDPVKIIRDISEAVMRQIVGDRSITNVLTIGRIDINNAAKKLMQKILDGYDTGIHIVTVKLENVNPPDQVKPAFNEVNEAKQEREQMINQAWETYNKQIPRAKGEAEKVIRQAEGYALNRVNRAKGDASRFLSIYEQYKLAEDVTRRRMYLETMSDILPKAGSKYIVDSDEKSILPLLNLKKGDIQ